jgi:hypothetical protein
MNAQIQSRTASILQFPSAEQRARRQTLNQANRKQNAPVFEMTTGGSAWYHEAAMAESDRSRKP